MIIQRQSQVLNQQPPVIEMCEVTDPAELAKAEVRREFFDRNSAWLQSHIKEVYTPAHRGKFLCIAGEEAFVGDTVADVIARATSRHPQDKGWFTRYIPKDTLPRVYAS